MLYCGKKGLYTLENQIDLSVVVVAIASGAEIARSRDALALGLIRQIAADLLDQFVETGEEDGLLILLEALHVAWGSFGE